MFDFRWHGDLNKLLHDSRREMPECCGRTGGQGENRHATGEASRGMVCDWPEVYRLPDLFFSSRTLNSSSVPKTWPLRVPGIKVSFSISPFFPLAMVTLFTSRVRPSARS